MGSVTRHERYRFEAVGAELIAVILSYGTFPSITCSQSAGCRHFWVRTPKPVRNHALEIKSELQRGEP